MFSAKEKLKQKQETDAIRMLNKAEGKKFTIHKKTTMNE